MDELWIVKSYLKNKKLVLDSVKCYKGRHVSYLPTQKKKKEEDSRVSKKIQKRRRPERSLKETEERQGQTFCLMLPSSSRLPKQLFSSFVRGGIKDAQYFSMVFSKGKVEKPRVACVVSKKVSPLATKRNLFRRRMYQAVREVGLHKFYSNTIIYLKKPGASLKKKEMAEFMLEAVSK